MEAERSSALTAAIPGAGDFERLVEDALQHLHDLAVLRHHPLASLLIDPAHPAPGQALHHLLVHAIEAVVTGAPTTGRLARTMQYLRLRYLEGLEAAQVARRLGITDRQGRRDRQTGVRTVASFLWEHYRQRSHLPQLPAVAGQIAALEAEVCEIYTDVDGVFTADPRVVPEARKIDRITYEEMLELAVAGAKVLQSRSVEYARRHGVPVHVRSSFHDGPGTWVVKEEDMEVGMEAALISGVALDDTEAKITFDEVPDRPGIAAKLFRAVASQGVNVDMIVQNVSHEGKTDMSFTVPREDVPKIKAALDDIAHEVGAVRFSVDEDIAKVSLVGAGMKSHPGVAADMFEALAAEGINIEMISTSPIRVSCVVRAADGERAVRAIHRKFGLDAGA